jgi:hypothetical protein
MTERDRSQLPIADDGDRPHVCRKLRTKLAFGSLEGVPDWRHGESNEASYWCLRTMESFGPDGSFSHPHNCGSGRPCFAAPAGADLVALVDPGPGPGRSRG